MKNILKSLLTVALIILPTVIQSKECHIPMCVVVDQGFANITPEASSVLETQLQRLATQSDLDIGWNNARFAITAKFDQIDKYVVGTAPTQVVDVFGVTLYIADIYNQKMFTSTYIEIKGVGKNDTKAAMDAIKRLNSQNTTISKFLTNSKDKIVKYYDSQLATIIKEAKVKSSMKDYAGALSILASVPVCCNGYETAMKEALQVYVLYRDKYFLERLNYAKSLWAANPTVAGSAKVVDILSGIDPDAKCYGDAMNLLSQIAKSNKTDIDYETKKKYEDAVALETLRIQAIAEIGKAYAANQPKVNILFLGQGAGIVSQSENSTSVGAMQNIRQLSNSESKYSGSEIFKKYGTAVFTIVVPSTDGKMVSQGSGFFIDNNGKAVTNYHVLDGGNLKGVSIVVPGTDTKYTISNIFKSSKENDFVVFGVNCSSNNYIPIADAKPNVGDKVFAIGSPKGFDNTFSSGEISQLRDGNILQTTVMIDHGSSGGALINESGQVVGITSGTFDSESVANLNYAMSIDVIK